MTYKHEREEGRRSITVPPKRAGEPRPLCCRRGFAFQSGMKGHLHLLFFASDPLQRGSVSVPSRLNMITPLSLQLIAHPPSSSSTQLNPTPTRQSKTLSNPFTIDSTLKDHIGDVTWWLELARVGSQKKKRPLVAQYAGGRRRGDGDNGG